MQDNIFQLVWRLNSKSHKKKDKFLLYEKALLKTSDHDSVFLKVYDITFNRFISDFKAYCKIESYKKVKEKF